MGNRFKEALGFSIVSLMVTTVVIALIMAIFILSGNQDFLKTLLQATVEGEVKGIAFTAVGPFSMWVIAFLILWLPERHRNERAIKVFLRFPEPQVNNPPELHSQIQSSTCAYNVMNNGKIVFTRDMVEIQIDPDVGAPYIYLHPLGVENPEYQVKIMYQGIEWLSDSYSPFKGNIDLR